MKKTAPAPLAVCLCCSWVAGNADLNAMYKHSHNPVAASALAVVFVFVLAVVLMNLLIGILTNSLERYVGGWVVGGPPSVVFGAWGTLQPVCTGWEVLLWL